MRHNSLEIPDQNGIKCFTDNSSNIENIYKVISLYTLYQLQVIIRLYFHIPGHYDYKTKALVRQYDNASGFPGDTVKGMSSNTYITFELHLMDYFPGLYLKQFSSPEVEEDAEPNHGFMLHLNMKVILISVQLRNYTENANAHSINVQWTGVPLGGWGFRRLATSL